MDVLHGGVDHAAGASGDGVQGGFKERSEDGWAYLVPVEIRGPYQQFPYLVVERRYLCIVHSLEKPAVRVGERCKLRFKIGVALILCAVGAVGNIERTEKVKQPPPQKVRRRFVQELPEAVFWKYLGIFCIEAENKPNAKAVPVWG